MMWGIKMVVLFEINLNIILPPNFETRIYSNNGFYISNASYAGMQVGLLLNKLIYQFITVKSNRFATLLCASLLGLLNRRTHQQLVLQALSP